MQFVTNNPNMPPRMFNGQPVDTPMFNNDGYTFNYFDTKKLVLIYSSNANITTNTYSSGGSTNASSSLYESSDNGKFTFKLVENLIIDKMSDVFLDNFTILGANASNATSTGAATYGITLGFDDIRQNIFSNNTTINSRELIVLNSLGISKPEDKMYELRNKKFNYLGVIQPGRYSNITGYLTDLNNNKITPASGTNLTFTIDLVISNQR